MPVRKAHKKSTLGCRTCKKRRVKCDLNRPECLNCIRLGRECGFKFINPTPGSSLTTIQAKAASPPQSLPDPSFSDELLEPLPQALQKRFSQLMKYHAIETSGTITSNAIAQSTWCALIPKLSASHGFVLQGIIAISALHQSRAICSEKEHKTLQDIAAGQMNAGLASYRTCVSNVTTDNAVALYTFSTATTVFALATTAERCNALLQYARDGHSSLTQDTAVIHKLVDEMAKLMVCFRGVMVILIPCWHVMVKGPLKPILDRDWWPHPIPTSLEAIEEDQKLHNLENLWMKPGRSYEYWFDTLLQALKELRDSFALVSRLTVGGNSNHTPGGRQLLDWTSVFVWITKTPPGFIQLIEKEEPEAWIILAHYAILPSRVGDMWWAKGFATSVVSTAALVIGRSMHSWIEWPASVIGINLHDCVSTHRQ